MSNLSTGQQKYLLMHQKHKRILAAPLLEDIDFSKFLVLNEIEEISVGGESYENARVCNFEWIRNIKKTCDKRSG